MARATLHDMHSARSEFCCCRSMLPLGIAMWVRFWVWGLGWGGGGRAMRLGWVWALNLRACIQAGSPAC